MWSDNWHVFESIDNWVRTPCWCWHVQVFAAREEGWKESSANSEWSSSRNSLDCSILEQISRMDLWVFSSTTNWGERVKGRKFTSTRHTIRVANIRDSVQHKTEQTPTKPFCDHSFPSPKARLMDALQNSGLPEIGAYSLSMFFLTISASAYTENKIFLMRWTQKTNNNSTHHLNRRQDIGLAIVITVGPNSQVHLLRISVSFECLCDTKNGIRGAHLNMRPPWAGAKFWSSSSKSRAQGQR